MMNEILENQYISSAIVFFSQIAFIYLRTINVIYTVELRVWPSIFTGMGIGFLTLLSISIGTKSFISGELMPVVVFILGGAVGAYWGIMQKKKKS